MLSEPPSKPTVAITLNTVDAVHLGVTTVSSSMLGFHCIPSVMDLCYKLNTIPILTLGEIPLDIGKKLVVMK